MKAFKFLFVFLLFSAKLFAQDAVLISEGNFVRGVIKGTNFSSVAIMQDDQTIAEYQAKDIQSFVWNGETYASKPIVIKKKMEFRFFKVLETGAVNLYSYGDKGVVAQAPQPKVKVRPSFGVGIGSGGFGGGIGGGITIGGGGRRNDDQASTSPKGKISYFLEKPGTGPMQEVNLDNSNAVKTILLQKLTNDEDLAESIKATESFDAKNLAAYVKAYNSSGKK
ncbi:hypothetical protein GM921_11625 [Pedobacter sp. LMG 31464]|uniref:DUF4369 domain-containing protein n=1 Tax=Pedobacter planticolens TaxID=2679964 RepID=A0A923E0G3_9SPHI|nr:hypothetical protein [Pedobacter planticolens]MBB2146138.1 hypothetical protein [Pedobacter planticolens]